jgi:hypothetical protein
MSEREDRVRKYILENFSQEIGKYSSDVVEATKVNLVVVCQILREMKDEEIISRRRNEGRWEYFLLNPHDVDEYIYDTQAGVIRSKKLAAMTAHYYRLKEDYEKLEELSKKKKLTIACECGKRINFNITAEVLKDDTS